MPQPKNGAAARKESGPRSIEFRGLTLEGPAKLPFVVLKHFAAGEDVSLGDLVAMLRDVFGDEQMGSVWQLDIDPVEDGADALGELVTSVLEEYGLAEGESAASSTS